MHEVVPPDMRSNERPADGSNRFWGRSLEINAVQPIHRGGRGQPHDSKILLAGEESGTRRTAKRHDHKTGKRL